MYCPQVKQVSRPGEACSNRTIRMPCAYCASVSGLVRVRGIFRRNGCALDNEQSDVTFSRHDLPDKEPRSGGRLRHLRSRNSSNVSFNLRPAIMCCHKLYIYTVCGHSALSDKPLMECRHASIGPGGTFSSTCDLVAHPYQSWRLEKLCPPCQQRRDALVGRFEEAQVVKFDEWKWKVSYGMPAHGGKDYWSLKADAREEEQAEKQEIERPAKKSNRFSLKRKSTRKSTKVR